MHSADGGRAYERVYLKVSHTCNYSDYTFCCGNKACQESLYSLLLPKLTFCSFALNVDNSYQAATGGRISRQTACVPIRHANEKLKPFE